MPYGVKPTISPTLFVEFLGGGGCERALVLDFLDFRMADKDSSPDDTDNEVTFYCSPSKGISHFTDLTCMELVKYLGNWGLSQAVCKALKGLYMLFLFG